MPAIREYSLAEQTWIMIHFIMLYKYSNPEREFWDIFIFVLD